MSKKLEDRVNIIRLSIIVILIAIAIIAGIKNNKFVEVMSAKDAKRIEKMEDYEKEISVMGYQLTKNRCLDNIDTLVYKYGNIIVDLKSNEYLNEKINNSDYIKDKEFKEYSEYAKDFFESDIKYFKEYKNIEMKVLPWKYENKDGTISYKIYLSFGLDKKDISKYKIYEEDLYKTPTDSILTKVNKF